MASRNRRGINEFRAAENRRRGPTSTLALAEIQDALGDAAAGVLPPLLALREVTVWLPEYIIRAFEVIAAEDRTTVDATVGFELIEFAGSNLTRMEGAIPGYREAYLFPGPV